MPNNFPDTDAIRQILAPYAQLIQRCFDRNLTVQQCAEYLAFSKEPKGCLPLEWLRSEPGLLAIQDVFWMQQREDPLALLERILGKMGDRHASWKRKIKFIARHHSFFLSWLPGASVVEEIEP